MHEQSHNCPACSRQFQNILDYPYVRIVSFKRMPIPEAIDYTSGTAAEKRYTSATWNNRLHTLPRTAQQRL